MADACSKQIGGSDPHDKFIWAPRATEPSGNRRLWHPEHSASVSFNRPS
jgi:hypothetical protein